MTLREVLSALRAGWWIVLAGVLLGANLALASVYLRDPLYTSSTQLYLSPGDASSSTTDVVQGGQFTAQRVASYAQMVTGDELATRIADELAVDGLTPAAVRGGMAASVVPGTVLINVSVTDPSPQRAQQIAAAVGTVFPSLVRDLEPSVNGEPLTKVSVIDRADLPGAPSSPNPKRDMTLGIAAGLLLGAALAVLRVRLDRSVKDPDEAAELAGAPTIGLVLRDEKLNKRHIIERGSGSRTAEEYRQLRNNLQFLNVDEPPKVIMIGSALPAEGKTTVAANLALALADAGRRVTVVESDLRRPQLTKYLGMVGGVGLTNVLAGTADLEDVVQRYGDGELYVIGAGPAAPNPGELLASGHMAALVGKLRSENDYVIFDAPPLLSVADASGLAVHMDGTVLSVRYGKTRKEDLRRAAAALDRVGARTLGIILNMVPPSADIASALVAGYTYGYDLRRDN